MSRAGFYQTARDVRDVMAVGHVGDVHRTGDFQSISAINNDPQAAAVKTITATSAVNDATYTVTIDGVAVSYVADGSATLPEISAGLKAAIDAEPGHRVTVVDDGVDTLTLTGLFPGVDFEVSVGANLSTATTTAADEADPLYPGRAVVKTSEPAANGGNMGVKHPVAADFTAQTKEITITTATGCSFIAILRINGQEYRAAAVDHNTDADTTAGDIVTAFDAVAPANTVSVANATGVLTFTAEVAGAEFDVEIIPTGAGGDAAVTAATGPSQATSAKRVLQGATVRRLDTEAATLGGASQLPGLGGVEVARRGRMIVARDSGESWTEGDALFISLASATAGRFYNAAGADRVYIGSDLVAVQQSHADSLGAIRLHVGA